MRERYRVCYFQTVILISSLWPGSSAAKRDCPKVAGVPQTSRVRRRSAVRQIQTVCNLWPDAGQGPVQRCRLCRSPSGGERGLAGRAGSPLANHHMMQQLLARPLSSARRSSLLLQGWPLVRCCSISAWFLFSLPRAASAATSNTSRTALMAPFADAST